MILWGTAKRTPIPSTREANYSFCRCAPRSVRHLEISRQKLHDKIFEPLLVFPVDEAIVEHPRALVRPEPDRRVYRGAPGCGDHQEPLENFRDVSKVERVVEPGRVREHAVPDESQPLDA